MNTEYGSPSNLPFDLAHKKWPICYNLSKSNYDKRSEIKLKLVNDLFTSINQIIKTNGTKDKLEPINNVPTINNIKKHIFFSNSKSGWHVHPVGYKINATYKIEPHLRIEVDIKKGKYKKSLTKNIVDLGFPDKSLFLCPCDIYFTGSLIDRYSLACVDNGRIIIPKPTYFYKEMNTFLVDDFEYKLSTLFNQKNEIREYLVRSKLSIMS